MGMLGVHGEIVWILVAARLIYRVAAPGMSCDCGAYLPAVSPTATSPFLILYLPWWSGTSSHSLMAAEFGGMTPDSYLLLCESIPRIGRRASTAPCRR